MQCRLAVLVITFCFIQGQTQIWSGVYRPISECSLSICCCPASDVFINESTTNKLSFNISLTGDHCIGLPFFQQNNIDKPTDYTFSMVIFIIQFIVTLSDDSDTISIVNSFGDQCTITAKRHGTYRYNRAIQANTNYFMLFSIILISTITLK
mgnify:FL=1